MEEEAEREKKEEMKWNKNASAGFFVNICLKFYIIIFIFFEECCVSKILRRTANSCFDDC